MWTFDTNQWRSCYFLLCSLLQYKCSLCKEDSCKTPNLAFKNVAEDNSLLALLGAAINGASTEMLKGKYDSDFLKLISLDLLDSFSSECFVLVLLATSALEWVLTVNFSYTPPLLSLLYYYKC